ncbi:hypothetical protein BD309DRAFT_967158 [Dichomitus squalens]|nr:hypothetical protein BD309DRAFT_967158 [Dichomitus squalens]
MHMGSLTQSKPQTASVLTRLPSSLQTHGPRRDGARTTSRPWTEPPERILVLSLLVPTLPHRSHARICTPTVALCSLTIFSHWPCVHGRLLHYMLRVSTAEMQP